MYLDIKYGYDDISNVVLRHEDSENPDRLHNLSRMLNVKNPAIQFAELATKGTFNDLPDAEYEYMLYKIKDFSVRFFDGKPDVNIFRLASEMAEFILTNNWNDKDTKDGSDEGPDEDIFDLPDPEFDLDDIDEDDDDDDDNPF